MHRIYILISVLVLGVVSTAFPQAKPAAPPPAPAEEPAPVLSVPKDYKYDQRGRRDPFVNPVPKPKAVEVAPPSARPAGLKGVLIAEATLAGVLFSNDPSKSVAIIAAPRAKTPYFAHIGDQLFDAVVKSITLDNVTFALTTPAANGRSPREIVRKVRPTGEDK